MTNAETGQFRCDPSLASWTVDEWHEGMACVPKCEQLGKLHGPGCCEARLRTSGAFCVFGKYLAKGNSDSKAVNCIGTEFELSIFLVR